MVLACVEVMWGTGGRMNLACSLPLQPANSVLHRGGAYCSCCYAAFGVCFNLFCVDIGLPDRLLLFSH